MNERDLQSNWLDKPIVGKTLNFQVTADGVKRMQTSKKKGTEFATYVIRVLPEGELEPKDLSLFVRDYKQMISDALGKDWMKLPNPSIVRCWFSIAHAFLSDERHPDGQDVYPITFLKDRK